MGGSVQVRVAPAGREPRSEAHSLLLELAGGFVGRPSLSHDEHGRPQVDGVAVSISYSRRRIAVAASYDGPVGVDLEEREPRDFWGLAERWFGAGELEWMAGEVDQLGAFLRLWTAKEAVGKALGIGLRGAGLRRVVPVGGGVVESAPGLQVTYVACAGAVLAVAAPVGVGVSPTLDPACVRG
ncbi:4'-phosphopantetheinyl transferase superfamily protein [Kribbella speibonae]|uniref:4'-phosphopantetheinyl transferase superfamily protein n=1 Tax=Kribbella speibonae TaxID=1572660 RepID=A0A4R0JAY2_9ACTN|nr:4'-phosphopantetheinyl transferase superfamily protein [Kribbella speibonae]